MVAEGFKSAIRAQFVGTWTLLAFEFRLSDGTVTYPMGKEATGMIIYDANGHMSVQMMRKDRPSFASGDQQKGTPEEIKTALEGYVAYFGDYVIDEDEQAVIHEAKGAMFPNWIGQDQKRFFEFSGDRLTLTTVPIQIGGVQLTGTLIWERQS